MMCKAIRVWSLTALTTVAALATTTPATASHFFRSAFPQNHLSSQAQAFVVLAQASPAGQTPTEASPTLTKSWADAQLITTLPAENAYRLALSSDGRLVAGVLGEPATRIKVWNAETGEELYTFLGHQDYVADIAFSPDGRILASADYYHPNRMLTIRLWDLQTGQRIRTLRRAVTPKVYGNNRDIQTWYHQPAIAFSPDGQTLFSAATNPIIQVWDLATGRLRQSLIGQRDSIRSLAVSADGQMLASTHVTGAIALLNLQTGEVIRTLQGRGDMFQAVFSPDGQQIFSMSDQAYLDPNGQGPIPDREARIWDTRTGELIQAFPDFDSGDWITFNPKGGVFAVGNYNGNTVQLRDLQTGEEIRALSGSASTLIFSPDGQTLAIAGRENIEIWR